MGRKEEKRKKRLFCLWGVNMASERWNWGQTKLTQPCQLLDRARAASEEEKEDWSTVPRCWLYKVHDDEAHIQEFFFHLVFFPFPPLLLLFTLQQLLLPVYATRPNTFIPKLLLLTWHAPWQQQQLLTFTMWSTSCNRTLKTSIMTRWWYVVVLHVVASHPYLISPSSFKKKRTTKAIDWMPKLPI